MKFLAACACSLIVACGGPERADTETPAAPPLVPFTTDALDARPPLAATLLEASRGAVLVGAATGELLLVFAQLGDDGWDAESARRVSVSTAQTGSAALLADGPHVLVAFGDESGLVISRVSPDGSVSRVASLSGAAPRALALARAADSSPWVAWLPTGDADAPVSAARVFGATLEIKPLTFEPQPASSIDIAPYGEGVVVLRASAAGVELQPLGAEVIPVTTRPAWAVAFARGAPGTFGWADDDGVHVADFDVGAIGDTRLVDGGERTGEAAHRIGAGLTLLADGDVIVAAYQDQTRGSLITARIANMITRQEHLDRELTRAFDVALARTESTLLSFDVGLRTDDAVVGAVRVEHLR